MQARSCTHQHFNAHSKVHVLTGRIFYYVSKMRVTNIVGDFSLCVFVAVVVVFFSWYTEAQLVSVNS